MAWPTAALDTHPDAQHDVQSPTDSAMARACETTDRKSVPSADVDASSSSERLHSTVRLNQFTLQFEDPMLESAYKAFTHRRKKALWLRSLIPATAFHILFGLGDCLEHPPDHLLVTIPARVFLSVLQISMFILVRWDLVQASESTMLLVSICNGIPTLLLYALQRSSLHQWDALFVVFGLSFYTIPKITPLGFVASLVGSWFTAILYAVLSLLVRPPTRPFESLLGFLYCAPVIGIFNTISYYSEYNSRERFVLRRRLRSESITLAVSRTKTLPVVVNSEGPDSFLKSNKFTLAVLLWGASTLGGWTSLPDVFKFVDEETGWAWFSHIAGLTMFLLVMTRQLQWLFVVPVLGAFILWMMSLAMPASWIIISAHSMGYGLLLASIIVAMGVFSRFVFVWRELVSFLTRTCFLYPQLQAGLQDEYPLLVKIVSEYTAGIDPEIISSRDSTSRALTNHASSTPLAVLAMENATRAISPGQAPHTSSPQQHKSSRSSPRRRLLPATVASTAVPKQLQLAGSKDRGVSSPIAKQGSAGTRTLMVESCLNEGDASSEEPGEIVCNKMVSVLPSFKAGKCFFCSKNEAEHLVPACGMWGKWTHWRMSQQQDIMFGSLSLPGGNTRNNGGVVGKPVQAMCTSYYDVQQQKSELEQQVEALEEENRKLRDEVSDHQERAKQDAASKVQLQGELRTQEERHAVEMQRRETALQKKMDDILTESNRVAHEHKRQLRDLEVQNKKLLRRLQDAGSAADELRLAREAQRRQDDENHSLKDEVEQLRKELAAARESLNRPAPATETTTTEEHAVAVQPSRRLPYARWIEVEGLRESIRKKDELSTDGRNPWMK